MGLLSKIFSNTKKPEGFFGKLMVNGMNGGGHAAMANWALSSLQIKEDGQLLDIGCGGCASVRGECFRHDHRLRDHLFLARHRTFLQRSEKSAKAWRHVRHRQRRRRTLGQQREMGKAD